MSDALYGVTAWPPPALRDFIVEFQARHRVAAYGQPHFNLRYPFRWAGTEEELVERVASAAATLAPFRATIDGWKEFPGALFLAVRPTPAVRAAHAAVLAAGGEPLNPGMDAASYVPHISVALGLLPSSRDEVVAAARATRPPVAAWLVSRLVVTRDNHGELLEVAGVPLTGAPRRARNRPA